MNDKPKLPPEERVARYTFWLMVAAIIGGGTGLLGLVAIYLQLVTMQHDSTSTEAVARATTTQATLAGSLQRPFVTFSEVALDSIFVPAKSSQIFIPVRWVNNGLMPTLGLRITGTCTNEMPQAQFPANRASWNSFAWALPPKAEFSPPLCTITTDAFKTFRDKKEPLFIEAEASYNKDRLTRVCVMITGLSGNPNDGNVRGIVSPCTNNVSCVDEECGR